MKPAFRFFPPAPDRASAFPAALSVLLAVAAACQLWLAQPDGLDESQAAVRLGSSGGAFVTTGPALASPVIAARNVFALPRQGATGRAAATGPLGGAVIAGSVRAGRRAYALVSEPQGRTVRLPIGGSINGWRLIDLAPDHASLARAGERLRVAYGAHAVAPAPGGSEEETSGDGEAQ